MEEFFFVGIPIYTYSSEISYNLIVDSTQKISGIHSEIVVGITFFESEFHYLSMDFHSKTQWSVLWLQK